MNWFEHSNPPYLTVRCQEMCFKEYFQERVCIPSRAARESGKWLIEFGNFPVRLNLPTHEHEF